MSDNKNTSILVVDDQESIREDFKKILKPPVASAPELSSARAAFFGEAPQESRAPSFDLTTASQGEEAVELVRQALEKGERFATAFIDVRMPPGMDGLQTIKRLWEIDPDIEVVICTAFSDYSFEQIIEEIGNTHRLLILKKPFDPVEVRQLAGALTEKWNVAQSERARLEELHEANERAQSANRAKSEFLANMSHEIRTPMNALLGYVEFLCDPEATPQERGRYGETIKRSSEHLLTILNDILDISRIEASRMVINHADVSPMELAREVMTLLATQAGENDIAFELDVPRPIPGVIETDLVRARQILLNLVGNAIKFTQEGSVRMVLRLDGNDASDHRYLCFDVIDTGIGISGAKLRHIFEPFSQVDNSTTRRYGGTGLGLTISKRLALLLGGDVEATSEPGRGSVFTLRLYAGELHRAELHEYGPEDCRLVLGAKEARKQEPRKPLAARVLVVEDVEVNQRLLAAVLRREGATVELAENGQVGMQKALAAEDAGEPFDVVLMDMQMPVMDGYEATMALRKAGFERPIVALTAHAMSTDRDRCLAAGCTEYETKPIQREHLLATIRRLISDGAPSAALPSEARDRARETR